jgi:hypothetical protein
MKHKFKAIEEVVEENGYSKELANVLVNLYKFMQQKQWWGACHASTSVLYVALKEIGLDPIICIGEVQKSNFLFDHSWIELDNKKIDLSISMTLASGMPVNAPVILDIDLETGEKNTIKYGVKGNGLDNEALFITEYPFDLYMDMFPDNSNGLWGIVEEILNIKMDIDKFKEKYKNVQRRIISNKVGS